MAEQDPLRRRALVELVFASTSPITIGFKATSGAPAGGLIVRSCSVATGSELAQLDAPRAAYLNWATGPDGYASQPGVWFNPPVPVHHESGAVGVLLVNERIIEQPFVFAELAGLPEGARILDVGGSESTVGLSLATLGHRVTIVDPRAHPLRHPNLEHAACTLDELPDPQAPFDVAVALSAVEHFGLQHYGLTAVDARLDLDALAWLRELGAPGGRLVLTVPFGEQATVDDFQRVYDEAGLASFCAAGRRSAHRFSRPSRERVGPPRAAMPSALRRSVTSIVADGAGEQP